MCRPDSIGAGTSQGMAEFGGVTVGDCITEVETGPLTDIFRASGIHRQAGRLSWLRCTAQSNVQHPPITLGDAHDPLLGGVPLFADSYAFVSRWQIADRSRGDTPSDPIHRHSRSLRLRCHDELGDRIR